VHRDELEELFWMGSLDVDGLNDVHEDEDVKDYELLNDDGVDESNLHDTSFQMFYHIYLTLFYRICYNNNSNSLY